MLILFLLIAFRSGSDRYYLKKAAGLRSGGKDVLYYLRLKNIRGLLAFNLCLYALKLLILLFSFLPFSVCLSAFLYSGGQGSVSLSLLRISLFTELLLFLFGTVFFLRLNSFLFPARYCFASGNYKSIKGLFRFSYACMQGNRQRVFKRRLSFIPWFFSCVFLLPIGFVRAYYHQSMADIAADLIQKHLQKA